MRLLEVKAIVKDIKPTGMILDHTMKLAHCGLMAYYMPIIRLYEDHLNMTCILRLVRGSTLAFRNNCALCRLYKDIVSVVTWKGLEVCVIIWKIRCRLAPYSLSNGIAQVGYSLESCGVGDDTAGKAPSIQCVAF